MKTILCIDDQPNTLKTALRDIYGNSFCLDYAANWSEYSCKLKADKKKHDIALIVLDYDLNSKFVNDGGDWDGPEVADDLFDRRPDLKFIGMTLVLDSQYPGNKAKKELRGRTIGFGHKDNKGYFVHKDDLRVKKKFILNISRSIIEDYYNRQWTATLCNKDKVLMFKQDGRDDIAVGIPAKKRVGISVHQMLSVALMTPNCFVGPFPAAAIAVDEINKAIAKKSDGRIWGMLSTEGAPTGCFKALIGSASIDYSEEAVCDQMVNKQDKCIDALQRLSQRIDEYETNRKKASINIDAYMRGIKKACDAISDVVKDFTPKMNNS